MATQKKYRLSSQQVADATFALVKLCALDIGITGSALDRFGNLTLELSDTHYTSFKLGDGKQPNRIVMRPAP